MNCDPHHLTIGFGVQLIGNYRLSMTIMTCYEFIIPSGGFHVGSDSVITSHVFLL